MEENNKKRKSNVALLAVIGVLLLACAVVVGYVLGKKQENKVTSSTDKQNTQTDTSSYLMGSGTIQYANVTESIDEIKNIKYEPNSKVDVSENEYFEITSDGKIKYTNEKGNIIIENTN